MKSNGFISSTILYLIVAGLFLSGVGLLAYGYIDRGRQIEALKESNELLQGEVKAQAQSLKNLRGTNEANLANVELLRQRLADAIGAKQRTDEALARARASLKHTQRDLSTALNTIRHDRERTYAKDQESRDWADQPVPRAIADGLRRQFDQELPGDGPPVGFGRGAGSAVGADPG